MASLNGHTATVQLLLGAGADKEARDQVREKKRERSTHTRMWLTRWIEEGSTVYPLFTSLALRLEHTHVAWGLA